MSRVDAGIVVGGALWIAKGKREEFIRRSCEAVTEARRTSDCVDFSVSADPLDQDRVNIFEVWKNPVALNEFRDRGPEDGLFALVERAEIHEYPFAP